MARLQPDNVMALLVDCGSIIEAHLLGRMREGKPVREFGRAWRVVQHRERDGKRLFELRADSTDLFDEQGDERPLMCRSCGGFDIRRAEVGYQCSSCKSTRTLP